LCAKAVDLLKQAPDAGALATLKGGGLSIDDTLSLLQRRAGWLREYGKLLELCGAPGNDAAGCDLAIAGETLRLLDLFEAGFDTDSMLDASDATLTYLWLKSISLRGGDADERQQLEFLFERWAQAAKMKPTPSPSRHHPAEDLARQPERLLVAWLNRWGFEVCEFIVLDLLLATRPEWVTGAPKERWSALKDKLVQRISLPRRQTPHTTLRIRVTEDSDKISEEIIGRKEDLPAYLLRLAAENPKELDLTVPDDTSRDTLLASLAERIGQDLPHDVAQARVLPVRIDAATRIRPEEPWIQVIPAHAEDQGLPGASVWLDLHLQLIGQRSEVHWRLYGGADPQGMRLEEFLKVVRAIKNQHDQMLATLERNVERIISQVLGELARSRSRDQFLGRPGTQGGQVV
jgi:hypothetical protein